MSARTAESDATVEPAPDSAVEKGRGARIGGSPTSRATNVEFEPLDLDEYMRLRLVLLVTWAAWDEQPGNKTRVNAYVDAQVACFGAMHNEFAKLASAVRRAGGSRESALEAWEADW